MTLDELNSAPVMTIIMHGSIAYQKFSTGKWHSPGVARSSSNELLGARLLWRPFKVGDSITANDISKLPNRTVIICAGEFYQLNGGVFHTFADERHFKPEEMDSPLTIHWMP